MIIYFVSGLLIAAAVYKLGAYAMLVGLMVAAAKVFVVLTVLAISILLWRRYRGKVRQLWPKFLHSEN